MSFTAKYQTIAQQFITHICNGQLAVNDKLPSVRTLCKLHNISMTTALACYRCLEQEGYAIAKEKKGYFVQIPHHAAHAEFPQFSGKISHLEERAFPPPSPINTPSFATAQLDESLIDHKLIQHSMLVSAKQNNVHLGYDEPQGNHSFRDVLSNHLSQQGLPCRSNDLVITNGCLDAVLIALETVSKAGDVIAISSPCYSGLLEILALLNRKVLEIPSTEDGIDLVQLEQAMNHQTIAACLFTANHQNPTGHSLSNQQKSALVQLAIQYQIPIVEDDVFRELSHQHNTPLPIKYYDQHGWVIWCSSLSKTLAPGLRIGWCLPGQFKQEYLRQRKVRTLGINQPIQLAMADYIGKGHYQRHLKKVNKELTIHTNVYINFLISKLPANAKVFRPHGGLVLWLALPNIDVKQLSHQLMNENIFIQTGDNFSTTALYNHYVRLNLGQIPTQERLAQLARLSSLVNRLS